MGARRHGARGVAVTAVLAALSLILLYLSAFVPTGQMGVVAIAGLVPAGAVISVGLGAGFCCYGVTGLLGLLLVPDKGGVLLYLLFFGLYPMLKSLFERIPALVLGWLCKLGFFNLILALFWFALRSVLLPFLPGALAGAGAVWLAGNVAFVIYDIGFSKLIAFYISRVDRVLRKNT